MNSLFLALANRKKFSYKGGSGICFGVQKCSLEAQNRVSKNARKIYPQIQLFIHNPN
jgi:hypothetical protein